GTLSPCRYVGLAAVGIASNVAEMRSAERFARHLTRGAPSSTPSLSHPRRMVEPMFEDLSDTELADRLCEQAAHVHAATARLVAMIAAFDNRRGWDADGCISCAQWLSWRCGLGLRAAQEHVAVARKLDRLPWSRSGSQQVSCPTRRSERCAGWPRRRPR